MSQIIEYIVSVYIIDLYIDKYSKYIECLPFYTVTEYLKSILLSVCLKKNCLGEKRFTITNVMIIIPTVIDLFAIG